MRIIRAKIVKTAKMFRKKRKIVAFIRKCGRIVQVDVLANVTIRLFVGYVILQSLKAKTVKISVILPNFDQKQMQI